MRSVLVKARRGRAKRSRTGRRSFWSGKKDRQRKMSEFYIEVFFKKTFYFRNFSVVLD